MCNDPAYIDNFRMLSLVLEFGTLLGVIVLISFHAPLKGFFRSKSKS